ncbi:MAG: hypothetical protein ABI772_12155 [Bacteroidota bacterium]
MRKIVLFFLLIAGELHGQGYHFTVDLNAVRKDKVKIILTTPEITEQKITYVMPAAAPGSYALENYGRFIDDFTAYDANGKKMHHTINENRDFIIDNATTLRRIEYWINDTWDDRGSSNAVFQASGTNIEKDKNFVINNFAFFGYFEGMQNLSYEITYKKQDAMFGSTHLTKKIISSSEDLISAKNYRELSDNPVMYCVPDTTSFTINDSKIYISVYSASGKVHSEQLTSYLAPLLAGIHHFLGFLPVDEYYFLFYFSSDDQKIMTSSVGLGGHGALEHRNCSFYFLPEAAYEIDLKSQVEEVCAHEFLHTITPLQLHSKEIEDFDFRFPKMSEHLWLYEGVTEYLSMQALMKSHLITEQDFLESMSDKIQRAASFPLFSMTDMSKNVLLPKQQDLYLDVYSKGALLAWFLDMQIITLTDGNSDLKKTVLALLTEFPQGKPFNDEELIDKIIALVNPELKSFFDDYISGQKALNYDELLGKSGLLYFDEETADIYKSGPIELRYFPDENQIRLMNENIYFGFKVGDELLSVNDNKIGRSNLVRLFDRYFRQNISPEIIELAVKRKNEVLYLRFTPVKRTDAVTYLIIPDTKAGKVQSMVRHKISGSF